MKLEFKNNQYLYTYQYKDHLGNVRLTYRDGYKNHATQENVKDGIIQVTEILDQTDYYPFGLKHNNNALADYSAVNKYKYAYNGKELNDELGVDLYDFGARNYDPALGRWLNVDPLAEQTMTPYQYCGNNPIMFIDPTGMNHGDYFDRDGNWLGHDGIEDKKIYILKEGQAPNLENVNVNWGGQLSSEHSEDLKRNSEELNLNCDLGKLSRIIFAEVRGEKRIEKEVVGDIIKNRVNSSKFPDSYEGVIKQPYQFSSLLPSDHNKKFYDSPLEQFDYTKKTLANRNAWLDSVGAAINVYNSNSSITQGSLLYYSPDSMIPKGAIPKWDFKQLDEVKVDGVRSNKLRMFKFK